MAERERFDGDRDAEDSFSREGDAAPRQRRNASRTASPGRAGAASGGIQSIRQGIAAIRDVRDIARQRANAKSDLRALKEEIDADTEVLDHRRQVERDFDRIVAEETAEIESARGALAAAEERIAQLGQERDELSAKLEALKAENEEHLRPYRSLMEATKGRADDAAVALADARRSVKSAEAALADATKRREQRIAGANRAVDNAQERLRRVQGELDKLQSDPNASISALPRMRDEVTTEHGRLEAARQDVEKVTAEAQQAVDNAQTHLWTQKKSLELAETQAEETKREATARREEFDGLYKQAQAEEQAIEESIKERTRSIADNEKAKDAASIRIDDAQTILDEAYDIHANPQVTAQLTTHIAESQAEFRRQNEELKELTRTEKLLRRETRGSRIAIFAIAGAVLIVILLVIWLVFLRGCSAPATSTSAGSATSAATSASTSSQSSATSSSTATGSSSSAGAASTSSSSGSSTTTGTTTGGSATGTGTTTGTGTDAGSSTSAASERSSSTGTTTTI